MAPAIRRCRKWREAFGRGCRKATSELHPSGSEPLSSLPKGNSQQLPHPFYRSPLPTNNVARSQDRNKRKNNLTRSGTLLTAAMMLPLSQPPPTASTVRESAAGARVQRCSWQGTVHRFCCAVTSSPPHKGTWQFWNHVFENCPGFHQSHLNQHFSCTA